MPKSYLPILLVGILSGCQTPGGPIDEDSPQAEIPAGSVFVLQRELGIPVYEGPRVNVFGLLTDPDVGASLTIQNGKVITHKEYARREPVCELETALRRGDPQLITRDRFIAGRSSFEVEFAIETDDRPFITRIPLASASQPGVKMLRCQSYGSPVNTRHLTIRQIRAILGEIFTLELLGSVSQPSEAPSTAAPAAAPVAAPATEAPAAAPATETSADAPSEAAPSDDSEDDQGDTR